jgi:Xaa-Pro aminopeptidase
VCLPGRGGACIEEEVVVTREGCEVLTSGIPRLLWE